MCTKPLMKKNGLFFFLATLLLSPLTVEQCKNIVDHPWPHPGLRSSTDQACDTHIASGRLRLPLPSPPHALGRGNDWPMLCLAMVAEKSMCGFGN
jgi:hypothetical protein